MRGRLGLKKIVFKVTEKKGDGKKSAEAAADGLLAQSKGSGLSDAEVAIVSTAILGSKCGTTYN